jgi:cyclophilin family peptidyl-prolyl cis-trans isomerase
LKRRADKALEAAVSSPDPGLRAAAAEALVYLTPEDAKPWRDRLATDKDVRVRFALINSLTTAEAARANRALVNSALADPDAGVRAAAVEALGNLGDPSVLPLLSDAVSRARSEAAVDVEIAAVAACEKLIGDPGARPIVESIYRGGKTLAARLARRSLVQTFRADRAAFADPEYKTPRSRADYAALAAEARKKWQAQVETPHGSFAIRLAGEAAPETVVNFVSLARRRFFDGVPIHRVVPNFVLQDGDPTGTGNGGPGYEIRDELNPIPYGRGTVGMALSGPDTGGSQWFVTHSPQPHLNGLYTVFGQIVSGQDVVERTEQGEKIVRITVSETP